LVVFRLALWKMMDFVSWDDEIPNWMEKNMFQPPTRESFDILCHYATINNWPWFFGWLDSNRIYSWWVFVALSKSQNIKMHYTTQLVYLNIQHIFTKLYPIVPIVLVVDIYIYISIHI
jgi:hypothetical protein